MATFIACVKPGLFTYKHARDIACSYESLVEKLAFVKKELPDKEQTYAVCFTKPNIFKETDIYMPRTAQKADLTLVLSIPSLKSAAF